jgi:C-terminal processing protease CtpA/Prc
MNASPAYLLLLTAGSLLLLPGGCYEKATDKLIPDGTVVIPGQEDGRDKNMEQNRWTYRQMKNDYLWEEHLPDTSALSLSDSPKRFFEKLLYEGDRFSWIERNPDFDTETASSFYDRYGLDYATYRTAAGELVHRLLLLRNETRAGQAGLKRGDWFKITSHTGKTLTLVKGSLKEGRTFQAQQQIPLQARNADEYTGAVLLDSVYRIDDRKVAYLFYTEFMDASSLLNNPYRQELKAVFADFKQQGATDLIVDLRYNHGGYVSICRYLGSLILKDEFLGEISGYHSYNKRLAAEQYAQTGNEEDVLFFIGANVIDGNNLGLDKAYFIITGQSASASESLINSLSPFIRTVTIGATSAGKGVGSWTIQGREYEWQLQPITFRYYNRDHETVPDSGLTPDIEVDETQAGALYDLGDTRELLLATALSAIAGPELRAAPVYEKTALTPVADPASHQRKIKGYIYQLP